MLNLPQLGYGLGLRAKHMPYIFENRPAVDWFEIISENYMETQGNPLRNLSKIRQDYPVVMHGVSLSIGTVDILQSEYLKKLAILIDYLQPAWVSDHLCWTGVAHKNLHDLLPIPYSKHALAHIIERIQQVQDILGRPIALENPSSYLEFQDSTMHEADFISQMQKATGCYLLLDVNNIYVSCFNAGLDPYDYVNRINLDKVIQIHLAGHKHYGTHIIDTHDSEVCNEVWALYQYVIQRAGRVPNSMLEWDDNIPEFPLLMQQLQQAKTLAEQALSDAKASVKTQLQAEQAQQPNPVDHAQPKLSLAQMQIAMQANIIQPDLPNSEVLNHWIKPKAQMSALQQLTVYRDAYRYRLFDAVAEDFTVLRDYLSTPVFENLLHDLISHVTPSHFNIARYSEQLLPFLINTMPEDIFAHEICQLELCILQMADLADSPALMQQDISQLQEQDLMQTIFKARTALRLMQFNYPVNDFYQASMQQTPLPKCVPQASYLVVYQDDEKIWRLDIDQHEYTLLSRLFSGKTVSCALASWPDAEANQLQQYFSKWMHHQLFAAPLVIVSSD